MNEDKENHIRLNKISSIIEEYYVNKRMDLNTSYRVHNLVGIIEESQIENRINQKNQMIPLIYEMVSNGKNLNDSISTKMGTIKEYPLIDNYTSSLECEIEKYAEGSIVLKEFISYISYIIIEVYDKLRNDINLNDTRILYEKIKKISETIKKLKEKRENTEKVNIININNRLSISLKKFNRFQKGEYFFKILIREYNEEEEKVGLYEKRLISNKKFMVSNSYDSINIYLMNFPKNDCTFHDIYLMPLRKTWKKKESLQRITKLNTVSNFSMKTSMLSTKTSKENRKSIDTFNEKSKIKVPNINKKEIKYNTSNILLNNKKYSSMSTTSLNNTCLYYNPDELIGINILSIDVQIERNGEIYANSELSIMDFLINSIDELCCLESDKIIKNQNVLLKIKDEMVIKLKPKFTNVDVVLSFDFFIDNNLRLEILLKIEEILNERQEKEKRMKAFYDDVLDLFSEEKERIDSVLENNYDKVKDEEENCINGCRNCVVY